MSVVTLEIDGRSVTADLGLTILDAARRHAVGRIPTLCHDRQLEPFASCFLCVVKVKGAKSLVPACSTPIVDGMVVETDGPEVRESRKAALELLLSDHYADCVGPCRLACPAGIDIQGYIALAAIGQYRDAVALIKQANPLPSVCGRVCTRPCEVKGCRRSMLDEAVGIDYIKRYVSDLDLRGPDAFRPEVAAPNGRKVAVVGAGPAGLSAAYYLAVRGYRVEVFEAQPEAGGMLRYGIPEYRLPKDVLDLEIAQVLALGPTLTTGRALGRDFTIASLKRDGFEAIFLAIGAWRSSLMRVQNEQAAGVIPGIEFLRDVSAGKETGVRGVVAVVGGGNTAIDCARTAVRLGAEVRLLYRRTRAEMPANDSEIRDAIEEGVAVEYLVAPTRAMVDAAGRLEGLECQRMELGEPDSSGRRSPKPLPGSEFTVPCDYVLAAIGQGTTVSDLVDGSVPDFLPEGQTLGLTRWQTIQVDEKTFETTVEGVFSGGDVATGAATAIEAIAAGRKAAFGIDTYLREGRARPEPTEFLSRKDTFATVSVKDLRSQQEKPRRTMPLVPVDERVRSFVEVELGYADGDLREEASRCLECGCTALFDCDLRKFATEYGVEVTKFLGEARQHERDTSHPLIELDPNKCILCGRCVRMCGDVVGVSAFGFVNRGFSTVVAPALGGSLLDTDCVSCGLCIGTCPTGAISERLLLAKPGPWLTRSTPSICHYCSVGCRINYETHGNTLVRVSRDETNEATFGHHCRKGRFGFGYVHAADRLTGARVRRESGLIETPVSEAIRVAAERLGEIVRRHGGRELAVLVSPRLTNEEIYLAQKLARVALRTHHVTSFEHLLNPGLLAPDVFSTATYHDVASAQVVLVAHSALADEHFVADLAVKRAIRNGGRLVYIGSGSNRTSSVADVHLACEEQDEVAVLQAIAAEVVRRRGLAPDGSDVGETVGKVAGLGLADVPAWAGVSSDEIYEAASIVAGGERVVLVLNDDRGGSRHGRDAGMLVAAAQAIGAGVLVLREKANMQGLLDMGAHPALYPGYRAVGDPAATEDLEKLWGVGLPASDEGTAGLGRLLAEKRIRGALVLGEDPLGLDALPADLREGLAAIECLVVCDLFATTTAQAADVVLPLSATAETSGTFTNSERRLQGLRKALSAPSGFETWQLIAALASELGFQAAMPYRSPTEVMDEIRRVVPAYRHAVIDAGDETGLWDRARVPGHLSFTEASCAPSPRVPTSALDHLDVRFERWFGGLFPRRD